MNKLGEMLMGLLCECLGLDTEKLKEIDEISGTEGHGGKLLSILSAI